MNIALLKKIFSAGLAILFSLYCMVGLGTSIEEEPKTYKNVILFIGDGMGENTIKATKQRHNIETLNMETMPVHASGDTCSFGLDQTDSAAGGTALACGIRVWINSVGILPFVPFQFTDTLVPMSLSELAVNNGKSAGVVTTDSTSGATPASFSAHALSRTQEKNISGDQLESDLQLIWGCASESITRENCAENGFSYITTRDEMNSVESGERSFAQFNFSEMKNCKHEGNTPSIEEMTVKAIDLLDDNEEGFFLMVEGACIDKFSHSNDFAGATLNLVEFDKAIGAALEYAEEDGETLIVVTADHETGGITYNAEADEYYYTRGDHSVQDVPVFVSADDAGWKDGKVYENRQTAVQIARVMGYGEDMFPAIKGYVYNK
ncbi:MAG: alkaline phosphatase [Clostridia bacterium]|nr:alkaline phosphatase [Clostridia bacterium]